jgi:AcrR family transcriptional regulator
MKASTPDTTLASAKQNLDRNAWVSFAIQVLAEEGLEGLRIEVLARKLKVTKGSFYWHFKDRQALLNAVVTSWRDARIGEVEAQTNIPSRDAAKQIRAVLDQYVTQPNRSRMQTELAIRDWARRDEFVANAVESVDHARLRSATHLLILAGYPEAEAHTRALLLFTHIFGLSMMMFEESIAATIAQRSSAIADLITRRPE